MVFLLIARLIVGPRFEGDSLVSPAALTNILPYGGKSSRPELNGIGMVRSETIQVREFAVSLCWRV